jgi:3-phenylpropionate/cinnamic acid dioxygenase small subunit
LCDNTVTRDRLRPMPHRWGVTDNLADRLGISEVLDDYARGIDSRDWDLVLSCFTDDAVLDYTAFGGPKGPAQEVVDWIAGNVANFVMTQHHITNRHITLDSDDAVCVSELFAPMGMASNQPGKLTILWTGGAYNDRFARTPDGWKIVSRVFEKAWMASGPEGTGPMGPKA